MGIPGLSDSVVPCPSSFVVIEGVNREGQLVSFVSFVNLKLLLTITVLEKKYVSRKAHKKSEPRDLGCVRFLPFWFKSFRGIEIQSDA